MMYDDVCVYVYTIASSPTHKHTYVEPQSYVQFYNTNTFTNVW